MSLLELRFLFFLIGIFGIGESKSVKRVKNGSYSISTGEPGIKY